MKIKTAVIILFAFLFTACTMQPATPTETVAIPPSPDVTATLSYTETPIPTETLSAALAAIQEAQKNLGSDYMLKAAADGKSYEVVVVATGETIKNLTFVDGVYQFVGGPDKFPYTVAEQAVKGGAIGDGKMEFGPWSIDVNTGKMEIHTVAVTELGGDNLPTLAIKWEKDESGKLTPETIAQIQTMFRARDEAMTAQARSAEFADLPANVKPAGWKGYAGEETASRGFPGAIMFSPRTGSGDISIYRAHSEWWPMCIALQTGDFNVQIFQSDGSEMDLMHLAVVAMDATGQINAYSELVPRSELTHLLKLATPTKRGELDIEASNGVKVLELFDRIKVEQEILSDPALRELIAAYNNQTEFFGSDHFRRAQEWQFRLPAELSQLILDGRDATKWTGR